MNAAQRQDWPVAELDPVRRLHVMAAGVPGMLVVEREMALPFEAVWRVASDLEHELPGLGGGWVTAFRYLTVEGERREALVRGPLGIRDRFRIVLRPGWCWMEGHALAAGMAAVPSGAGTRFAWASGLRLPGGRLLRPLARRGLEQTLAALEQRARERMMPTMDG